MALNSAFGLKNTITGKITNISEVVPNSFGTSIVDLVNKTPQFTISVLQDNGKTVNIVVTDSNVFQNFVRTIAPGSMYTSANQDFFPKPLNDSIVKSQQRVSIAVLGRAPHYVIDSTTTNPASIQKPKKSTPATSSGANLPVTAPTNQGFTPPAQIHSPSSGGATTPSIPNWPSADEDCGFKPVPVPRDPGSATTRIGYAVFDTPIHFVSQQRSSYVDQSPTLREPGTIKRNTGFAYQTYTISYVAATASDIKNSVQEVLEQVILNPFTYCQGGPFGEQPGSGDIPFQEFAVQNVSISTVPGLPSALAVDLTLSPFLFSWYCPQTMNKNVEDGYQLTMDDITCWPLVKLWAKTRGRSNYNELPGRPLNGKFVLSLPSQQTINQVESIAMNSRSVDLGQDYAMLTNFYNILSRNSDVKLNAEDINHPNLKRVSSVNLVGEDEVYILKVSNKGSFEKLSASPGYLGLADWDLYKAHNFVDDTGKFLPQSGNVDVSFLDSTRNVGFSSTVAKDQKYKFLAITKNSGNRDTAIGAYYNNLMATASGTVNPVTEQDKLAAIESPWENFAVALSVNSKSHSNLTATVGGLVKAEGTKKNSVINPERQAYLRAIDEENNQAKPVISSGFGADDDVVIESMNASRSTNITPLNVDSIPLPVHQYLGGGTTEFTVKGKCLTLAAKKRLEKLKDDFDLRCINLTNTPYGGGLRTPYDSIPFIRIQNELFQLMGVDFVMPLTLSMNSVQDTPGIWDFELILIEYSPRAQAAERMRFLPTTLQSQGRVLNFQDPGPDEPDPLVERANEYFSLQYSLAGLELLPDMNLPSHTELRTWVQVLRDEAHRKLEKKVASKDRKFFEEEILDICAEYFESLYCVKQMSKFIGSATNDQTILTDSGSWVDPDFYLCYDPASLWGAMLDKASNYEYGTRGETLQPGKLPDPGKATAWREYDPLFDTYTIHDSDHLGSGIDNAQGDIEKNINTRTFPEANRDLAVSAAKRAGDKMDKTEGAWWKENVIQASSNESFPGDVPQYLNGENNTAYIPIVEDANNSAKEANDTLKSSIETRRDFLSYQWRIQKLKEASTLGAGHSPDYTLLQSTPLDNTVNSRAFLVPTHTQTEGVLGSIAGGLRDIARAVSGDELPSNAALKALPEDYLYISTWFKNAERSSQANSTWTPLLQKVRGNAFTKEEKLYPELVDDSTSPIATDTNAFSFYQRTAIQSANYNGQAGKKEPENTYQPSGSSTTAAMFESAPVVDFYSQKYKVDPNLVRAFMLRRTGFGLNTERGAAGDGGYFHLSTDVSPANATFEQSTDLIASKLAFYLNKYNNSPTLAITAISLELTSVGRQKGWVGNGDKLFSDDINRAFDTAKTATAANKYGFAAKNSYNKFMSNIPTEIRALVDDYWAGYIEVSRVMGAHINSATEAQRDLFFTPFSAYILADVGEDVESVSTSYTPSGERMRVWLSRTAVSRLTVGATGAANQGNISAEEAALIRIKVDFGLDPHTENAVFSAMLDVRTHGKWGRLVRAFPTYSVLIINEGFFYSGGNIKLWDQFYTRGGVTSIEVFKSDTDPTHKAFITYSNMFGALTRYSQFEALRQQMAESANNRNQKDLTFANGTANLATRIWNNLLNKIPDKEILRLYQNNHLQQLAMNPGSRVQVRLGYGSNASQLEPIFNGRVVEVPVDAGTVTIMAEGDGWELTKPITDSLQKTTDGGFAYQSPTGVLGTGTEPAYIVAQTMVPNDVVGNIVPTITDGRFGKRNYAPHFGDVYFDGNSFHTPELFINMYGASKGKMEQQFDWYNQILSKNAIYNWDQTTLISVSVKEPTTWHTAKVCKNAVMDFVTSVEPFHTQSTLFFGKWWYPLNYGYDPSILQYNSSTTQKEMDERKRVAPNVFNSKPNPIVSFENKNEFAKLHPNLRAWLKATKYPDQAVTVIIVMAKAQYPVNVPRLGDGLGDEQVAVIRMFSPSANKFYLAEARYSISDREEQVIADTSKVTVRRLDGKELQQVLLAFNTTVDFNTGRTTGSSDLPAELVGEDPTLLRDVRNLVRHLKWKSYCQVWPAITGFNLVNNSISSSSKSVFTDAIGQNVFNGSLSTDTMAKTITFSVDSDIQGAERKTLLVDTGLYVTATQKGYYESLRDGIGQFTPVVGDSIKGIPDTPAVENSVVTALCETVRTMYQGVFTTMGQAGIKPNDLILLNDSINNLEGPVFVRNVTHVLNFERGFVTIVAPGCVALPHTSFQGAKLITSLSVGPVSKVGQYMVGRMLTTLSGAYLKNKIGSPFHARIEELNTAIQELKSSELVGPIYTNSSDRVKQYLSHEIDRQLADLSTASPFTASKKRRGLMNLRKVIADANNSNIADMIRRARDLNIEIPAFQDATTTTRKFVALIVESQKYHSQVYKELVKEFGKAVSPKVLMYKADQLALKFLQDRIPAVALDAGKDIIRLEKELATQTKQLKAAIKKAKKDKASVDQVKDLLKKVEELTKAIASNKQILADTKDDAKNLEALILEIDKVGKEATDAVEIGLHFKSSTLKGEVNQIADAVKLKDVPSGTVRLAEKLKSLENKLRIASETAETVKAEKAARAAYRMTKAIAKTASIASFIGPQVVLRAAIEVVRLSIGASVIEWINASLRARQCVRIIPLRTKDASGNSIPYVAGIRGHQGAVVGDDISYFDKWLGGWLGGKNDSLGAKASMVAAAIIGIEVPEYGSTDVDSRYLELIRKGKDVVEMQ